MTSFLRVQDAADSFMLDCLTSKGKPIHQIIKRLKVPFQPNNKLPAFQKPSKNSEADALRKLSQLAIAAESCDISVSEYVTSEFSAFPSSIWLPNREMRKTDKSKLRQCLLETLPGGSTHQDFPVDFDPEITCLILDGIAYINKHSPGAKTFNRYREEMFGHVVRLVRKNHCKRVDIVFDKYPSPSIKHEERHRRQTGKSHVIISINSTSAQITVITYMYLLPKTKSI